jgi:hypothetical protein
MQIWGNSAGQYAGPRDPPAARLPAVAGLIACGEPATLRGSAIGYARVARAVRAAAARS